MLERPNSPSLEKLSEEIGAFDEKKPADMPQKTEVIVGSDAAMRMGLEFVISVLGCAGAGLFLDHWLGTSPLLMLIGLFLGAVAGFWVLFHASNPPKA